MVKVKVPELLKERGLNATDLMHKANIAYATAYSLSKGRGQLPLLMFSMLCANFLKCL